MTYSRSHKGYHSNSTAYAIQRRQPHRISPAGMRESVRAALSALQHGHSGPLKGDQTPLGSPLVKVIRRCLSSEAFGARGFPEGTGTLFAYLLTPT